MLQSGIDATFFFEEKKKSTFIDHIILYKHGTLLTPRNKSRKWIKERGTQLYESFCFTVTFFSLPPSQGRSSHAAMRRSWRAKLPPHIGRLSFTVPTNCLIIVLLLRRRVVHFHVWLEVSQTQNTNTTCVLGPQTHKHSTLCMLWLEVLGLIDNWSRNLY